MNTALIGDLDRSVLKRDRLSVGIGVVNGSATPYFTPLSSSSYLLVLALAVTAVIAVVVIYFATRRLQRTFFDKGQPKTR